MELCDDVAAKPKKKQIETQTFFVVASKMSNRLPEWASDPEKLTGKTLEF